MKETALYFLHEVAKNHPDNQFAKAIFNRFNKAGQIREEEFKSSRLLNTPDDSTPLGDYNPAKIERGEKDFRFLHLYLKTVRKFPGDKHYGLSFCRIGDEGSIPESTLLLGRNGTGKTSIFDTMEYLFTYNASAANKMGFKSDDALKDYLPYAGKHINDIAIGVQTRENNFTFFPKKDDLPADDVRQLCLKPFFCSEYDVDKLIAERLNRFIYEQMGYGLVMNIIEKLENEMKEAISLHTNSPAVSPEEIEFQLNELDKDIGMFQDLRTYFIYLVVGVNSNQITKECLDALKGLLNRSLSINNVLDKLFPYENDLIIDIFGENTFTELYTELEKSVRNAQIAINPTIQKSEWDRQKETLDRLQRFRRCLRIIIDNLLTETPNVETSIRRYDSFIREKIDTKIRRYDSFIQKKIDTKKAKEDQARDSRFTANEETYNKFLTSLKDKVYGTIDYHTRDAREIINEVMKIFAMEDEEMSFSFNKDNGTFDMKITLNTPQGKSIPFPPEKYLNTFRYKLYCMTLKVAIAFAMKKFYQMNFPIVIDDIFYSSDFTYRGMVRRYFRMLFEKHKELFPEPKNELQVIFLSHDEVIIEAASRGIRDAKAIVNRQMLFDYREADSHFDIAVDEQSKQTTNITNLTSTF